MALKNFEGRVFLVCAVKPNAGFYVPVAITNPDFFSPVAPPKV